MSLRFFQQIFCLLECPGAGYIQNISLRNWTLSVFGWLWQNTLYTEEQQAFAETIICKIISQETGKKPARNLHIRYSLEEIYRIILNSRGLSKGKNPLAILPEVLIRLRDRRVLFRSDSLDRSLRSLTFDTRGKSQKSVVHDGPILVSFESGPGTGFATDHQHQLPESPRNHRRRRRGLSRVPDREDTANNR